MELKGSKTEQNLMTAFAGESQARNKYTYFASKAKKEGSPDAAAEGSGPSRRRGNVPTYSAAYTVASVRSSGCAAGIAIRC